jgi:hypothetical protein
MCGRKETGCEHDEKHCREDSARTEERIRQSEKREGDRHGQKVKRLRKQFGDKQDTRKQKIERPGWHTFFPLYPGRPECLEAPILTARII